jgi:hypothetical protein
MSTNYYAIEEICGCCGDKEEIHIGKSSVNWKFLFQYNAGEYYTDIPSLKDFLAYSNGIVDEYGRIIQDGDFWNMVYNKQHLKSHDGEFSSLDYFKMGEYEFLDVEFS